MSTLTREEILTRLRSTDDNRLIVTPLLSQAQIGIASIDVRLGTQFIVFKPHVFGEFEPSQLQEKLRRVQERHIVSFGNPFVLHPGMLALGSTFEYVSMPGNLECQVEGRSSWARVGLQIATANSVEPLFKGVITLELSNVGTIPLVLYPGLRVAQLVFHEARPKSHARPGEKRKYHISVGPEFSRLHLDGEFGVLRKNPLSQST